MSTKKKTLQPCTDTGNAEMIASLHGEVLRFDHKQGRWLIWHKRRCRWSEDTERQVRKFAIDAARSRRRNAARISDKSESQREYAWALTSENQSKIDAALEIARSLSPISDPGTAWDADPWLFGVGNGVINLRTGRLRTERPEDRITKHSPLPFDPAAKCPRFEQFMNEIFNGDIALVEYAQRMVGYCLTGSVKEQCVFCWYGPGGNGKTTFILVLRQIVGSHYAVNLPFSALETKNRNSNDLVALAGARLVTAVETNEGMRLNEARIKALTGGDPITARRLYHESFTFDPTHKLLLAFNHKPSIADDSEGMWRRVRLVPFTCSFKGKQDDKELPDKLIGEAPGILAWAVRGCLAWQKQGLGIPPAVASATAAYRDESDHLGEFIEDCCVVEPSAKVMSGELWDRYKLWTVNNEEVLLSRKSFSDRLERRGFLSDRSGHGGTRTRIGIRLREQSEAPVFCSGSHGDTLTQGDTSSDISLASESIGKFSESPSPRVTTSPVE